MAGSACAGGGISPGLHGGTRGPRGPCRCVMADRGQWPGPAFSLLVKGTHLLFEADGEVLQALCGDGAGAQRINAGQ